MSIDFSGKKASRFKKREISQLLFTSFAFSAIFFLYKWKSTDFSYATGVSYFIFLFVVIIAVNFFVLFFQKRFGISKGYTVEFENNMIYLLVGVIITFLFQGYLLVIVPGFITLAMHQRLRLGHFRPLVHEKDIAMVALAGPITYVIIFLVSYIFYLASGGFLWKELMRVGMVLALFYMLPAPQSNGLAIYKWSSSTLLVSVIIALAIFIIAFITEPSLILGTIIGAAAFFFVGVIEILPRIFYGR